MLRFGQLKLDRKTGMAPIRCVYLQCSFEGSNGQRPWPSDGLNNSAVLGLLLNVVFKPLNTARLSYNTDDIPFLETII